MKKYTNNIKMVDIINHIWMYWPSISMDIWNQRFLIDVKTGIKITYELYARLQ